MNVSYSIDLQPATWRVRGKNIIQGERSARMFNLEAVHLEAGEDGVFLTCKRPVQPLRVVDGNLVLEDVKLKCRRFITPVDPENDLSSLVPKFGNRSGLFGLAECDYGGPDPDPLYSNNIMDIPSLRPKPEEYYNKKTQADFHLYSINLTAATRRWKMVRFAIFYSGIGLALVSNEFHLSPWIDIHDMMKDADRKRAYFYLYYCLLWYSLGSRKVDLAMFSSWKPDFNFLKTMKEAYAAPAHDLVSGKQVVVSDLDMCSFLVQEKIAAQHCMSSYRKADAWHPAYYLKQALQKKEA